MNPLIFLGLALMAPAIYWVYKNPRKKGERFTPTRWFFVGLLCLAVAIEIAALVTILRLLRF